MVAECYIEGPIPDSASSFVACAYTLSLASAFVYLMLGLMCGVAGNQMANNTQMELLTNHVRLPVHEITRELDEGSEDSVAAFERQNLSQILRIPGFHRLQDQLKAQLSNTGHLDQEDVEDQIDKAIGAHHLELFHRQASEWEELNAYAMNFTLLGVSALLQAYAYWAAAGFYQGLRFYPDLIQALMILLDATLTTAYIKRPWAVSVLNFLAVITGPLAAHFAIRDSRTWVDNICVALCFFAHFCASWMRILFFSSTRTRSSAKEGSRGTVGTCESGETLGEEKRQTQDERWLRFAPYIPGLAVGAVSTLWLLVFVGVLVIAVRGGLSDNGVRQYGGRIVEHGAWTDNFWCDLASCEDMMPPGIGRNNSNSRRLRVTRAATGAHEATVRQATIEWPNPHTKPQAVACGGGSCYVASEFLVFKIEIASPERDRAARLQLQRLPCNISGAIRSLAVWPNADADVSAEVIVLESNRNQLASCQRGGVFEISSPAPQLVSKWRSSNSVLVADSHRVLEYELPWPKATRFQPLWAVADTGDANLAAMDIVSVHGSKSVHDLLVLFYPSGNVEVWNMQQRQRCRSWDYRQDLLGGAVVGRQGCDLGFLLLGAQVSLTSWLQIPEPCCTPESGS
eukprot:TRINITY_DN7674_c0_g1_i1.p1 TRINITY_DN7674_c0_g1~~TRINITY_DN7674_c0_g1_i1.p1  ORF type:complete len:733 (-),score=91.45 TRINITY_DN7674_c0_g1_i1:346-2226(-)